MNELRTLFLEELADAYNFEQQITKALPKMIKKARSSDLREALEEHLNQTESQLARLEEVFSLVGKRAKGQKCEGVKGIISEGEDLIADYKGCASLDAAMISAAQKVEHYEIAHYGTLCAWAKLLNNSEAWRLLKSNLQEEKNADEKLTEIAERHSNLEAAESETALAGSRRQTGMRVGA